MHYGSIECVICARLCIIQPEYWKVWEHVNYTTKLNTEEVKKSWWGQICISKEFNMKEHMKKMKSRVDKAKDDRKAKFKAKTFKEQIESLLTDIIRVRIAAKQFSKKLQDKTKFKDVYEEEYIAEMNVNTIMHDKEEIVIFIAQDGHVDYGIMFHEWGLEMRVSFF